MARSEHHTNEACGQTMAFDNSNDDSRRPLTGDIEKCYNSMFLAVNAKFNFSVLVFLIGNGEIVLS